MPSYALVNAAERVVELVKIDAFISFTYRCAGPYIVAATTRELQLREQFLFVELMNRRHEVQNWRQLLLSTDCHVATRTLALAG